MGSTEINHYSNKINIAWLKWELFLSRKTVMWIELCGIQQIIEIQPWHCRFLVNLKFIFFMISCEELCCYNWTENIQMGVVNHTSYDIYNDWLIYVFSFNGFRSSMSLASMFIDFFYLKTR